MQYWNSCCLLFFKVNTWCNHYHPNHDYCHHYHCDWNCDTDHIFSLAPLLKKTRSQKWRRSRSQNCPVPFFKQEQCWNFKSALHYNIVRWGVTSVTLTCELQGHHWLSDLNSRCGRPQSCPHTINPDGNLFSILKMKYVLVHRVTQPGAQTQDDPSVA